MKKFLSFAKSEIILVISFFLAIVSMFFVHPSLKYLDYINFSVLIILFCLMITVAGMRNIGFFKMLSDLMLKKAGNSRKLGFIMMNICFFSSMLITNDVALITFVPLTILILEKSDNFKDLILIAVIETVAANLGSAMTPVGNPHNLYIYSYYNLSIGVFFKTMFPFVAISYVLLSLLCFALSKNQLAPKHGSANRKLSKAHLLIYFILFIISLLTVLKIIPDYICLAITLITVLIVKRKLLLKVDYSLLFTFVFFFIFVGNAGRIDAIRDFISNIVIGREILVAAALSQVLSNVPTTVMLSGFTDNAIDLLKGVTLGGLGTPIASMASLITYKFYVKSKNANVGAYMKYFLFINFAFMAILMIYALYS
ncbi:MAG: citrate transporter [Ruminococcus sp.]|nr:citrate transporter [Ruminococcus sp.]